MIRSSNILNSRKVNMACIRQGMEFVDHEWVSTGVNQEFTIFASQRPLGIKEVQMLLEGQRSDQFRVINCDEELYVADDKMGVIGDIVTNLLGAHWRVVGATQWGEGNRHNSYRLQKYAPASRPPV